EPDDQHPAGGDAPAGVEVGDLAGLALELLGLEDGAEEAVEPLVERGQLRRGPGGIGVAPEHHDVGANLHRAAGLEGELHVECPPGKMSAGAGARTESGARGQPLACWDSASRRPTARMITGASPTVVS